MLFIDASRGFKLGTTQNYLRDEDVAKIAAAFHSGADEPKYARVVDLAEIEKNDFMFNVARREARNVSARSHGLRAFG